MQQLVPHQAEKEEALPAGVRDIDAGEEDDPTLVSCYARPVYKHLMEVEVRSATLSRAALVLPTCAVLNIHYIQRNDAAISARGARCSLTTAACAPQQKYRPDPQYMTHQNDINANMRGILVDWLVEVSEEYKLHTETLFLSINYIDRFLSRNNVQRGKLQLVGITCMLVAAKYEEIYPPSVEDFVYISDNAYSREQVIAEEVKLLNALKFHCTVATSRQFLRRFAKAARADHTTHEMAHYLAELSLLDINFVKFPPSVIAAASILIAINTTHLFGYGNLNWDATMQYYTTYSFEDLEPCANALLTAGKSSYNGSSQFRAVKEKYSQGKFDNVANRRLCDSLSK
jgi:cyclin-A